MSAMHVLVTQANRSHKGNRTLELTRPENALDLSGNVDQGVHLHITSRRIVTWRRKADACHLSGATVADLGAMALPAALWVVVSASVALLVVSVRRVPPWWESMLSTLW